MGGYICYDGKKNQIRTRDRRYRVEDHEDYEKNGLQPCPDEAWTADLGHFCIDVSRNVRIGKKQMKWEVNTGTIWEIIGKYDDVAKPKGYVYKPKRRNMAEPGYFSIVPFDLF